MVWFYDCHTKDQIRQQEATYVCCQQSCLNTVDEWHHVAGAKNPANLGTGGLNFDQVAHSDGIRGPKWLKKPIILDEESQHPVEQDMNVQVFVSEEETVATID